MGLSDYSEVAILPDPLGYVLMLRIGTVQSLSEARELVASMAEEVAWCEPSLVGRRPVGRALVSPAPRVAW